MLSGFVPCLRDYGDHGNIIRRTFWTKRTAQLVFVCDELWSNAVNKKGFMVIAGKEENGHMLWIDKVLLLFNLKEQVDRAEKEHVGLYYMECTRPLDKIYRSLGRVCIRNKTTHEIDSIVKMEFYPGNRNVFFEWVSRVETIEYCKRCRTVYRSSHGVKPLGGALAWPCNRFLPQQALYIWKAVSMRS